MVRACHLKDLSVQNQFVKRGTVVQFSLWGYDKFAPVLAQAWLGILRKTSPRFSYAGTLGMDEVS